MSQTILIKLGGEVFRTGELGAVVHSAVQFRTRGDRVVMFHGGGPQATELQRQLGQEPVVVAGRRVTDKDALDVMKMVVGGRLNIDLCAALLACGVCPVGLNGASSNTLLAKHRPPRIVSGGGPDPIDFGHVGDIEGVNTHLLNMLLEGGYMPVIACLGADSSGRIFNINADVVANHAATHLRANHLLLVTGAPGVLRDKHDLTTRIPTLTVSEAKVAISKKIVVGGMIPKLEESTRALQTGQVGAIHIVGHLREGDLEKEVATPGSVGTALLPDL